MVGPDPAAEPRADGLTGDETTAALAISPATADRLGRYARAWLLVELQK